MNKLCFLLLTVALTTCQANGEEKDGSAVEQTTASPIGKMSLAGEALKPTKQAVGKETVKQTQGNSQPHTIADFIIHPLIALKPRVPATENAKQANGSANTPSPWQLLSFSPGQGLGSSFTSLAGSLTGWLGNRMQFPGLLETPVSESSISSTTTTTSRPGVVIQLQQRPAKKPLTPIANKNERPFRRYQRPNRYYYDTYADDSEENDDSSEYNDCDDFDVKPKNRIRYQNYEIEDDDDDDDGVRNASHENNANYEDAEEEDDDQNINHAQQAEEDQEENARPYKLQNNNLKRPMTLNKGLQVLNQRRQINQYLPRKKPLQQKESAEEYQYEYDNDDDDDDDDQDFYYNTKRSQNELNFIQRGQQNILKQIRQLTERQTPAEISNTFKSNKGLQQPMLLVKRNGQAVYVVPELLQIPQMNQQKVTGPKNKQTLSYHYPQLALTAPYKRKSQPIQYITIPWKQLGISPPNKFISRTEDIQSKPLIFRQPQSATENMKKFFSKNKLPKLTADAVPLLAEASVMDIFKPPRMPAARTPTNKPTLVIATKTKAGSARIRPATVIERAPTVQEIKKHDMENNFPKTSADNDQSSQFLVIADEPAKTNLSRNAYRQILGYLNQNRSGRKLNSETAAASSTVAEVKEQLIPVQIIVANEEIAKAEEGVLKHELNSATETSDVFEAPKMEKLN